MRTMVSRSVLLVILTILRVRGKIVTNLKCPELLYSNVDCSECRIDPLYNNEGSIVTNQLTTLIRDSFVNFGMCDREITWTYAYRTFEIPFTYVTIYTQSRNDSRIATTVTGCCGIAMQEGMCRVEPLFGALNRSERFYVSFALFRVRIFSDVEITQCEDSTSESTSSVALNATTMPHGEKTSGAKVETTAPLTTSPPIKSSTIISTKTSTTTVTTSTETKIPLTIPAKTTATTLTIPTKTVTSPRTTIRTAIKPIIPTVVGVTTTVPTKTAATKYIILTALPTKETNSQRIRTTTKPGTKTTSTVNYQRYPFVPDYFVWQYPYRPFEDENSPNGRLGSSQNFETEEISPDSRYTPVEDSDISPYMRDPYIKDMDITDLNQGDPYMIYPDIRYPDARNPYSGDQDIKDEDTGSNHGDPFSRYPEIIYPNINIPVTEYPHMNDPIMRYKDPNYPDMRSSDIQYPDREDLNMGDPYERLFKVRDPTTLGPNIKGTTMKDSNVGDPNMIYPNIRYPDLRHPDMRHPDMRYHDMRHPDIKYPDVKQPEIRYPALGDPTIPRPAERYPKPTPVDDRKLLEAWDKFFNAYFKTSGYNPDNNQSSDAGNLGPYHFPPKVFGNPYEEYEDRDTEYFEDYYKDIFQPAETTASVERSTGAILREAGSGEVTSGAFNSYDVNATEITTFGHAVTSEQNLVLKKEEEISSSATGEPAYASSEEMAATSAMPEQTTEVDENSTRPIYHHKKEEPAQSTSFDVVTEAFLFNASTGVSVLSESGHLFPAEDEIRVKEKAAFDGMPPWEKYVRQDDARKYAHVCLFEIPKEQVLAKRSEASPFSLDHYLFRRGVYNLPGYFYRGDAVLHKTSPTDPVNCTRRSYGRSTEKVYDMWSPLANNDTYTCLVLWLTIATDGGVQVKCMPRNATYVTPASLSGSKRARLPEATDKEEVIFVIAAVSSLGLLALLVVVFASMRKCAKRVREMTKAIQQVPGYLDDILCEEGLAFPHPISKAVDTPEQYEKEICGDKCWGQLDGVTLSFLDAAQSSIHRSPLLSLLSNPTYIRNAQSDIAFEKTTEELDSTYLEISTLTTDEIISGCMAPKLTPISTSSYNGSLLSDYTFQTSTPTETSLGEMIDSYVIKCRKSVFDLSDREGILFKDFNKPLLNQPVPLYVKKRTSYNTHYNYSCIEEQHEPYRDKITFGVIKCV